MVPHTLKKNDIKLQEKKRIKSKVYVNGTLRCLLTQPFIYLLVSYTNNKSHFTFLLLSPKEVLSSLQSFFDGKYLTLITNRKMTCVLLCTIYMTQLFGWLNDSCTLHIIKTNVIFSLEFFLLVLVLESSFLYFIN